jgi:hypothetical protein
MEMLAITGILDIFGVLKPRISCRMRASVVVFLSTLLGLVSVSELVILAVSVLLLLVILTLMSVSSHRCFASEDRLNCPTTAADTTSVLEMSKC